MRTVILFIAVLFSHLASAQVIKGVITSTSNDSISFAQIELVRMQSGETENLTYSNDKGVFSLNLPDAESFFKIKVSVTNYATFESDSFAGAKDFGQIQLEVDENLLDVTVIKVDKKVIERTGRGLNVNVASSPILENSNAKDILSKIPGVTVDQDGNFTLNGQRNVQVFINGKPSLLSLEQLVIQLESTPGTDIEKIEVFNTPPARFDAEGTGGIINIIKKKSASKGLNGNTGLNTGMGKYVKSNSWFNFNYRNYKINVYGKVNTNQNKGFFDQRFELNTQLENEHNEIHNIKYPIYTDRNLSPSVGLDYEIDSNTTIGLLISTYAGDFDDYENLSAKVINGTYNYNKTLGYRDLINTWNGQVYNINFERKLKKGDLNFDFDIINNFNDSKQITENDYWLENSIVENEVFTTNFDVDLKAISTKVDYARELKNKWNLETGLKYSSLTQISIYYSDFIDSQDQWENALNFEYNEQISAGFFALNKAWKKKWKFDIGFRVENTVMDGQTDVDSVKFNQTFTNIFPNASLNYEAHENWVHSLSVNRRIRRPEYLELTPFEQRINPYLISIGNPNLRPQIKNEANYGLSIFEHFNLNLLAGVINNSLFLTPTSKEGEVIQRFKYQNLGEEYNFSASISGPIKPMKRWLILWNGTVFHNRLENSPGFNFGYTSFFVQLQNQIKITRGWKAEFMAFYHHKHYWNVWQQNEFVQFDASLSKRYNDWKFNFTGSDIFGLRMHRGGFNQGAVTSINSFEPEKQVFKVSAAYTFGNKRLKKQRERGTGAEDVQDRT